MEPEECGGDDDDDDDEDDSGSETTNDGYWRVAVGILEDEPEGGLEAEGKRCLCVKEGFGGVGGIRCGRGCDLA